MTKDDFAEIELLVHCCRNAGYDEGEEYAREDCSSCEFEERKKEADSAIETCLARIRRHVLEPGPEQPEQLPGEDPKP